MKVQVIHNVFGDNMKTVLTTNVKTDNSETDILDYFYYITQNIDQSWVELLTKKEGITIPDLESCRSTSVGDMIKLDDKTFLVMNCGFEEITGKDIKEFFEYDELRKTNMLKPKYMFA